MWGSREYGPNTGQVKRFIERLQDLSPDEWRQVREAADVARAAYSSLDWRDIEAAHKEKYGEAPWLDAASHAVRRADWMDPQDVFIAHSAVLALADAEVITPRQFGVAYAPFAEIIPIQHLGHGKAPGVKKPPDTLPGRFVSRLNSLPLAQWDEIWRLAYAVQEAVGVDAINAAEDAETNAVGDRKDDVIDLLRAKEDLYRDWPESEFVLHESLYQAIGDRVQRSDWATSMTQRLGNTIEGVTLAADRALGALVFRDAITPKQFWTLYAPFAAAIPPESLEVKRL